MEYKHFKVGDSVVNALVKKNLNERSIEKIIEIPKGDKFIHLEDENGKTRYDFRTFYRKATEQELKIHKLKNLFQKV